MSINNDPFQYSDVDGRELTSEQITLREAALQAGEWWTIEHDAPSFDVQVTNLLHCGWEFDGERHARFLFKKRKPLPKGKAMSIPRIF